MSYSPLILSDALELVLGTTDPQVSTMKKSFLIIQASSTNQSLALASLSSLREIHVSSTSDDAHNTSKGTALAKEILPDPANDISAYLRKKTGACYECM